MVAKGVYRKGQFFIIGTFMLCTLFYIGMPRSGRLVTSSAQDLIYLSDNLEKEIPNTLNLCLNEAKPIECLLNFTRFADRIMLERFINFTTLWIVTENISTNNLNITIGNYLGSSTNVTLAITGAGTKSLMVQYNSTNYIEFEAVPSEFNLLITFDSEEKSVTWQKDKVNIYAFTQLKREDDLLKREITG